MAQPILDDKLWAIIEPLLPAPKKRRKRFPGRRPIDNRKALSAILFILKTGLPWEHLPQELGWGSGMTAWRRLHVWQKRGVWQRIHATLLANLQQADHIDWSRAVVDSSSVRAVHGGKKRAPVPQIAANPAASITWSPTPTAFPSRPR
jgi:transposase